MKKQLLSILLCLIMVVGLLPTAALAEEAAPPFNLETYQGDIPVIELVTRTHTDIKVTENDKWEYSIDSGANWQGSCHFTNLSPGTEYTIIARVKATATHQPSANSAPLNVTTMHTGISDELKDKLRAVVSAYEGEYDSKEHEAVIVDTTKLPTGWTIAGYSTDSGNTFSNDIPKIKDAGTLGVGVKFVHPDYLMNITSYYTAEVTPKPLTNDMIADIPNQLYTGQPIHPKPEIKHGDMVLMEGTDFTYSYDTNTSPEQGGKVTITGKGNYKGMASKSFNIVNEITEITEDDLKDLEIPTLVTVKCTTTNSSKKYGRIPGGFDLSKKPYMENGVWKAIVQLNLPAYKAKYDADTKKTHENAGVEGNTHTAFTLKYVNSKWMIDGNFPAVVLRVTCNGNHENQTYTVTFDGNGGRPTNSTMTTTGKKLASLPTATRSGRYSFDGWYTERNCGTKITTATVFEKNTTVYAHWTYTGSTGGGVTTYPITVKSAKNGDVTASHKSAAKGTTITLTVDPDKGYVLDTLTVLDGKDKEIKLTEKNGKYTFTMPDSKVTVEAMFKAEQTTGKNPFIDVPAGSYYEDAVIWAVDKGITTGTSATTFNPNGICTRAQAVTFLWRAAGSPAAKSSAMPFTDVKAGSYYETAVLWAVENGITKGTSDTMFSPDATCTRAQIVTFLWRANGSPAVSGNSAFTDVASDAYYAAAVTWAEKNYVTGGIGGGLFGSNNNCTRAQIVTFIYRSVK